MILKIALPWLQLTREKMRLLVALAGISFANILMFMQLGFRDALYDSSVSMHIHLQGDIFLISPQSTALIAMKSFSMRRLYQTLSIDAVKSISPMYVDFALWKNPQNRRTRAIFVMGFNPTDSVFDLPEVVQNLDKIKIPDVVLFDAASRAEFGPIPADFNQGKTVTTEVGRHRIKVGGLFTLGASFGADGNLITSDLNFLRIFDRRQRGLIDIGIVTLQPGADAEKLKESIIKNLGSDVKVFTHTEFIEFEKTYWKEGTSIGFIFSLGTAMGFIVGTVIVYQVLYTDVADHLAEYATLKAMEYTDGYLLMVVFQEALILAGLGYIPGCSLAFGLYNLTRDATQLPIAMTAERALWVLILTVVMCTISGAIAVRKLRSADPADIF